MRAFLLNENTNQWEDKGIVARNNFWSTAAPEKMENGNWIIPGFQVNYSTGVISINAINITSTVNVDSTIDFTLIPSSNDVVATRGILIDISSSDISVKAEVDTIASGESSAGVGYSSTSTSTY